MWTLWLTVLCVPVPNACPSHSEIAEPAWFITGEQTEAQCEEHKAWILDQANVFVLNAQCTQGSAPPAPTNLRILHG